MHITDQELTIRNATKMDAPILYKWWNDSSIMSGYGFPNGLEFTEKEILEQLSTDTDESKRRLIIEVGSIPVGEMFYRVMRNDVVDIGIKVCEQDYQDGFGIRFLELLMKELFKMGFKTIDIDPNPRRVRSQHGFDRFSLIKRRVRRIMGKASLEVNI